MKYSERQYCVYDPFEGDRDTTTKCRTVKIVRARKEHRCFEGTSPDSVPHDIKVGQLARREAALVDGEWGVWYSCLPCMDAWLTECGVEPTT